MSYSWADTMPSPPLAPTTSTLSPAPIRALSASASAVGRRAAAPLPPPAPIRYDRHPGDRNGNLLGIAHTLAGASDDRTADPARIDALADRLHPTGDRASRNVGRACGHRVPVTAIRIGVCPAHG
jgi:hypothetical protein